MLAAGRGTAEVGSVVLDTERSGNWYDVTVTSAAHPSFSRRFMGHMETGKTTTSDPAMYVRLLVFLLAVTRDCRVSSRFCFSQHYRMH